MAVTLNPVSRENLAEFIKDQRTVYDFEQLFDAVIELQSTVVALETRIAALEGIQTERCIFQNTANSTAVTATGAQVFDVSHTVDAGELNTLGLRIRVHAAGVLTAGANAGTLTLGIKVGGVQVTTAYTIAYVVSAANGWEMDWILTVRTIGSSGKFIVQVNEFVDYGATATREGNNFFTTATQLPAGGCDLAGAPKIEITTNVSAAANSNVLTDLAIFIENPGA